MKKLLATTLCGLALTGAVQAADQPRQLRVYNWADYMLPEVPKAFAARTGIQVTWDVFDTNEARRFSR